jgi:hypothetical protein
MDNRMTDLYSTPGLHALRLGVLAAEAVPGAFRSVVPLLPWSGEAKKHMRSRDA